MSYDYSAVTPYLGAGKHDIFTSLYKNIRFHVPMFKYIVVDASYEANLPGLSYDTYGTTDLWRAILHANGLADPINDVCVGVRLGLPEPGSLLQFLTRQVNAFKQVVI